LHDHRNDDARKRPAAVPLIAEVFAANLRRERRIAGLNQEQAAARAQIHRTEVSLLERCGRIPRIDTLLKLAGALEAEPADLLRGIEWVPVLRDAHDGSGWALP
jgi:transcriptional regulator with XRE-family HTH domain